MQVDLNDVAQAMKEQRNALADHNAILAAHAGALQRKVESLTKELEETKAKLPKETNPA